MSLANLFADLPAPLPAELVEQLVTGTSFTLERIVSLGHVTPPGQWYDQESNEWVLLLSGAAQLRLADEPGPRELRPGDYLLLPAHCRHRVEWTTPDEPTVWLALHYQ